MIMTFVNWFCIIYTIITLICFCWVLYAIHHAPSVDPTKPFLKGDITKEDLEKDEKEE